MIGIISAMKEEIQALLDHLKDKETIYKGKRTYFYGNLFDRKVVMVFSRWGKVASATTATQLINDFDIKEIIFTGVAGSVQEHINIGDIIIGKNLYQYDMDASPLIPRFEIPLLKKTFFQTHLGKREILKIASSHFISDFNNFIGKTEAQKFNIHLPKVHIEDIASGDQFISTSEQISTIKNNLPHVGCVEMEGAAVAQVCYEYGIPFSIIRTISDKADDNSHIEFQVFANEIAGKYALGILKMYFELVEV